ncbi:MAG TPA: (2Fe-2S)-binding protein [Candidatus Nanopelagicaceae bacterium]|nr:(2Fe-2S)-binding protein [Candidatus Nanopelagicaceae bacterium]
MRLSLRVNSQDYAADVEPGTSLLDVLRDELHLTGTKEGCVEGECGACTVLVDGRPLDACLVAAHGLEGTEVTTIEGIGTADSMSSLQKAMVEAGGVQCGFCTPGIVMTLTALIAESPNPTEHEIRVALAGNICRCTGYAQIVDAVLAHTSELQIASKDTM